MTGKNLLPLVRGEVDTVRDFAIAGYHRFSTSIITEKLVVYSLAAGR